MRRSTEILMKSSNNKKSLEKRNTLNPQLNKKQKAILEPSSVRSSKYINFKDEAETKQESNHQTKSKRKSQISKLNKNESQSYKTSTLYSNNSSKTKQKTSKENNYTLNTNENLKSQQNYQNIKNLKDDLTAAGESETKIYNHESEKIVYPNSAHASKHRSSAPKTQKARSSVKNRSKSEFDISVGNKNVNISEKEKAVKRVEFDKNSNYNISRSNNFNKNDLKNLEKIIEINNSNSNLNFNLNNSHLNKSEVLNEDNANESKNKHHQANFKSKDIKESNFDYLQDPNFIYNTNSNKNKDNSASNQFIKHQRINSVSGSIAGTNNLKNSRVITNSRMNTSNTEKKAEIKAKKMSLISPESLKTDFINYENESRRKSALYSKRNSEAVQLDNYNNKSNRSSIVSTSNSKSRSKVNFNNLKNAFNSNQSGVVNLNTNNTNKDTKENLAAEEKLIRNDNFYNNHRESNHSRFNSHTNNYYENLNFNYKNEFDVELKEKINHIQAERTTQNRNYSQQDNYKRKINNKDDCLVMVPSARESAKEEANVFTTNNKDEIIQGKIFQNAYLDEKFLGRNFNDNENTELSSNFYTKAKEIKPSSTDKFRDLSPIRESEYSHDIYKKKDPNVEIKIDNIDLKNNNNESKSKNNLHNENISKATYRSNTAIKQNIPITSRDTADNNKRPEFPESKNRINNALSNFNNLYEFKNNIKTNFIYDEVHEKILPITNFEGESYPENLYREDKVFLRDNEMIYNRRSVNSNMKIEDCDSNRNNNNYKSNEFSQSATRKGNQLPAKTSELVYLN